MLKRYELNDPLSGGADDKGKVLAYAGAATIVQTGSSGSLVPCVIERQNGACQMSICYPRKPLQDSYWGLCVMDLT